MCTYRSSLTHKFEKERHCVPESHSLGMCAFRSSLSTIPVKKDIAYLTVELRSSRDAHLPVKLDRGARVLVEALQPLVRLVEHLPVQNGRRPCTVPRLQLADLRALLTRHLQRKGVRCKWEARDW